MASRVFPKGKEGIMDANIDLNDADVRVMLVLSAYTYDANDEFVADLGAVDNGRSATLGATTVTNGVFDANDTSLTALAASACNAIIYFVHTGSDATARLICYVDTVASGLPLTPGVGGTVSITHDNGANKIIAWND